MSVIHQCVSYHLTGIPSTKCLILCSWTTVARSSFIYTTVGNAWPQVTNADIFKLNYGGLIDASTYISRPQANYDILAVYSCKMPQDVKIRTKIKGKGREWKEREWGMPSKPWNMWNIPLALTEPWVRSSHAATRQLFIHEVLFNESLVSADFTLIVALEGILHFQTMLKFARKN